MSPRGTVVVATVDQHRHQVIVTGRDVNDIAVVAEIAYRTTGSGAVVIDLDDLGAVEIACAIRHRPVRIQSRRAVTR